MAIWLRIFLLSEFGCLHSCGAVYIYALIWLSIIECVFMMPVSAHLHVSWYMFGRSALSFCLHVGSMGQTGLARLVQLVFWSVAPPHWSLCHCLTCPSRSSIAYKLTSRLELVRLGHGAEGAFLPASHQKAHNVTSSHSSKVIRAGDCVPGSSVLKFHNDFSSH